MLLGDIVERVWKYRKRTACTPCYGGGMNTLDGKAVLVPASQLDDLLELARIASERLPEHDPLASNLRGAAAQVRAAAVLEP